MVEYAIGQVGRSDPSRDSSSALRNRIIPHYALIDSHRGIVQAKPSANIVAHALSFDRHRAYPVAIAICYLEALQQGRISIIDRKHHFVAIPAA